MHKPISVLQDVIYFVWLDSSYLFMPIGRELWSFLFVMFKKNSVTLKSSLAIKSSKIPHQFFYKVVETMFDSCKRLRIWASENSQFWVFWVTPIYTLMPIFLSYAHPYWCEILIYANPMRNPLFLKAVKNLQIYKFLTDSSHVTKLVQNKENKYINKIT